MSVAFSTDSTTLIEQEATPIKEKESRTLDEAELHTVFDVEKTIAWIQDNGYQRVCI